MFEEAEQLAEPQSPRHVSCVSCESLVWEHPLPLLRGLDVGAFDDPLDACAIVLGKLNRKGEPSNPLPPAEAKECGVLMEVYDIHVFCGRSGHLDKPIPNCVLRRIDDGNKLSTCF